MKERLSESDSEQYELSREAIKTYICTIAYTTNEEITLQSTTEEVVPFKIEDFFFYSHYKRLYYQILRRLERQGYVTSIRMGKRKQYKGTKLGIPPDEKDKATQAEAFRSLLPIIKDRLVSLLESITPGSKVQIMEMVSALNIAETKDQDIKISCGNYVNNRMRDMVKRGFFVLDDSPKKYAQKRNYTRTNVPIGEYIERIKKNENRV